MKGIISDIEGVLIENGQPIGKSVEVFNKLKQTYQIRLLSNTSTKPADVLTDSLMSKGFFVAPGEVITAVTSTKFLLQELKAESVFLVTNEAVKSEFSDFTQTTTSPDAIMIGDIGERWDYALMQLLFEFIQDESVLVAMHKGKYWKKKGLKLDIGAFIAGLEYATGAKAYVAGKPQKEFFQAALKSMALPAQEVIMVGDDLDNDIKGAYEAGIDGYLVQTGKYRKDIAEKNDFKTYQLVPAFDRIEEFLA